MRMKDLIRKTGVARTTIHFYLREGLLPPPEKTARNAAIYDEAHVRRLGLLQRFRSGRAGGVPLSLVRRILNLVEGGADVHVAEALAASIVASFPARVDGFERLLSVGELARASSLPPPRIRALITAGLLLPLPGPGAPRFDTNDVLMARTYDALMQRTGFTAREAAPIAAAIRRVSALEFVFSRRVAMSMGPTDQVRTKVMFQDLANVMHPYLLFRSRLHDIAAGSRVSRPGAALRRSRGSRRRGVSRRVSR